MQPCFSSTDCVFVAGGFPIATLTPSDADVRNSCAEYNSMRTAHSHNTKITRATAFLAPARVICLLQLREIGSAVIRIVRNLRTQRLDAVELLLRAHEFQERQPDVPPV